MQIATVHKIHHILEISIKTVKFIWRHAFVLAVFGLFSAALIIYPAIDWTMLAYELLIAFTLDRFKNSLEKGNIRYNSSNQMLRYAQDQMNSSRLGSSAWARNPMKAGSPASHLYNLGYMTTKYN